MTGTRNGTDVDQTASVEADLIAATRALLDDWACRADGALERTLSHFAPNVVTIGSGTDEVAVGLDRLTELLRREHDNVPVPFTYTLSDARALLLNPSAGLVLGDLELQIPQPDDERLTVAYRHTCALRNDGSGWLVVLWQTSRPDPEQADGDSLPIDALRARNQELERLVAERTASLREAQAQLVQKEKMASLGALTAGIAHELKNPLNFVNNFAALSQELVAELADEADPDVRAVLLADLKANAAKIEEHGRRADGIVRSMMEHARSGSGERRAVAINDLVEEYAARALYATKVRHPDLRVALDLDLAEEAGLVEVVPQEIGRVLVNLVANALDAVRQRAEAEPDGYAPTVTVSTCRTDGGVEVRVEDNGPGMAEAVRARVFEPFFTTKPTGEGTGLGLSMSYDIVTQGHGGTLAVESAEGEGAAFVLGLPRGDGA